MVCTNKKGIVCGLIITMIICFKGGCCKSCGSVEHFYRDCPEVQKQSNENRIQKGKSVKEVANLFDFFS